MTWDRGKFERAINRRTDERKDIELSIEAAERRAAKRGVKLFVSDRAADRPYEPVAQHVHDQIELNKRIRREERE